MRNYFKSVLFLLIGAALFAVVQEILTPNWTNEARPKETIYGLEHTGETNIDVIFLGSSKIYCDVSPVKLYRDYHITSYDLSTAGQPVECSYYLLKQAFKTQSPKLVVYEASSLFRKNYDSYKANWHYILDVTPFSYDKLELIKAYAKHQFSTPAAGIFLPIYDYHARWKMLTADDFILFPPQYFPHAAGEDIYGNICVPTYDYAQVDWLVQKSKDLNTGSATIYSNNETIISEVSNILYKSEIPEINREYLLKMHELCEENNAQFMLTASPALRIPQDAGAWTLEHSAAIREIAVENGIDFYDLNFDVNLGLERTAFWHDNGSHLNIRGANVVTSYLGEYLSSHFNLPQRDSMCFNDILEAYGKIEDTAWLQSETDIYAFLNNLIANKEKWTVFISASSDYAGGFTTKDEYALFEYLGLDLISSGNSMDSYLAIIDGGEVVYEALSDRLLQYETTINDLSVSMASIGVWNQDHSIEPAPPSIQINGVEYSVSALGTFATGLNFVVWDKETNLPIHSAIFDTHLPTKIVNQHPSDYLYLAKYKSAVSDCAVYY